MTHTDLVVIGGGPAGLAAALAARKAGVQDILILEREDAAGGILNQCIHNGFGLHIFGEELTGPEYAGRYLDAVHAENIPLRTAATVLTLTADRIVTAACPDGLLTIQAGAVVLAMGCRERPRGAINIPGTRPAGVYTAGTAQKFVNIDGILPGRDVVVLGSGDIGLIMARRMTLEGARVHAVVEQLPYAGGLTRNVVQCLNDYDIPLLLQHTVTRIVGRERVEAVEVAALDEQRRPVPGSEQTLPCDTLLLSVGLLPENELSGWAGIRLDTRTGGAIVGESLQTSVPGIFSCGNTLHVHDLVDFVTEESEAAGRSAAAFLAGRPFAQCGIETQPGIGVRYTLPHFIDPAAQTENCTLSFRTSAVFRDAVCVARQDGAELARRRARILTPGEMQTLKIPINRLAAGGGPLTLSIEEVRA